jgi:hypothetical protein
VFARKAKLAAVAAMSLTLLGGAVIANTGSTVAFDHFTAQKGNSSPSDLLLQSVRGYHVTNSANTSGGALRIGNTGSTSC